MTDKTPSGEQNRTMGAFLPKFRDLSQRVRKHYMIAFGEFLMRMLCFNFHEHGLMQLCNRGGTPLPDDQLTLEPTSSVLGGKLSFDSYNNGGEWLNSVHDVGASLVRAH